MYGVRVDIIGIPIRSGQVAKTGKRGGLAQIDHQLVWLGWLGALPL